MDKHFKKLKKKLTYGFFSMASILALTLATDKMAFAKRSEVVPPIQVGLLSRQQHLPKPQVEVKVDLKAEEGDQKNVDAGHSPWKLDPAFVSQVFVGLKLFPEGIVGEYPISYEEFKVVKNNGVEAVVRVGGNKTPIRRVYLKRLIRQDNTGIWTVVGYDPVK